MSNYHILTFDKDEKTIDVVFHIAIPNINNVVNVPYRTALVDSLGGADKIISTLTTIDPAELALMKTGEIYEIPMTVRFSSTLNMTDGQRLNEVIAAYNNIKTSELANRQQALKYYGRNGDVV